MNPLIFLEKNKKLNEFECNEFKKTLINGLDYLNSKYSSSILDDTYDIIHFISLSDYAYYEKSIKKGVKKVISLFYSENDINGRILKEIKNKDTKEIEYKIDKSDLEILSSADLLIVPSLSAKNYLLSYGITNKIEVLPISVKSVRFNLNNTVLKKAAFNYFQIDEKIPVAVLTLYYKDYEGYKNALELAKSFPKIKFIVISQYGINKFNNIKLKKILKEKPSNLIVSETISDDLYCSLMFNATYFINISSSFSNIIELSEAMISKTQIFALSSSQFNDIIIDKETGYIYNSFDLLKEGLREYNLGLLDNTINNAYDYIKTKNIEETGKNLIKIYKDLLEE